MYEKFFGLTQQPFSLTPNTQFYCALSKYQEALNVLLFSLEQGEGFLKITGEVGLGKTLLCRELLNNLADKFKTAYFPNPRMAPVEFNFALAKELGLEIDTAVDQHTLLQKLQEHLVVLHTHGMQIVLIIDEAQCMSNETLETLRLLTNLETEKVKLIQVVLFGQPELDQRLRSPKFRQLLQRITFSYHLAPLSKDEFEAYLSYRLTAAGSKQGTLFTKAARKKLYRVSYGVPRIINILAHKSLLAAYGLGKRKVDVKEVKQAIHDSADLILTTEYYAPENWFKKILGLKKTAKSGVPVS